jgi:hypothetical protein
MLKPAMLRVAVPVLVRVTLCAALVVPIFWEVKLRLVGERFTVGAGGGGVKLPPPPPQATQTPAIKSMIANSRAAGRRLIAGELKSKIRVNIHAGNPRSFTGRRKLGGTLRCKAGGAPALPVVEIASVLVTAEVLPTVTDQGEKVQVAFVGQPLATLRSTVPVNP